MHTVTSLGIKTALCWELYSREWTGYSKHLELFHYVRALTGDRFKKRMVKVETAEPEESWLLVSSKSQAPKILDPSHDATGMHLSLDPTVSQEDVIRVTFYNFFTRWLLLFMCKNGGHCTQPGLALWMEIACCNVWYLCLCKCVKVRAVRVIWKLTKVPNSGLSLLSFFAFCVWSLHHIFFIHTVTDEGFELLSKFFLIKQPFFFLVF